MQCASSTTSSRTRLASEVDWSSVRKSEENTFSGDMKRTFSTPDWSNETAWTSVCGVVGPERTRDGSNGGSCLCWSCMSAMSGEITSVSPSWSSVGIWYVSDFPLPVGAMKSWRRRKPNPYCIGAGKNALHHVDLLLAHLLDSKHMLSDVLENSLPLFDVSGSELRLCILHFVE